MQHINTLSSKKIELIIIAGCIIIGSFLFAYFSLNNESAIPSNIATRLNFFVWLPNKPYVIEDSTFKYDQSQGVLTFDILLPNKDRLVFAEQQTPSQFNDLSTYVTTVVNQLGNYDTFDSLNGAVYLNYPRGVTNAAMMNSKNTLMFVTSTTKLSDKTWEGLFNNLSLQTKKN